MQSACRILFRSGRGSWVPRKMSRECGFLRQFEPKAASTPVDKLRPSPGGSDQRRRGHSHSQKESIGRTEGSRRVSLSGTADLLWARCACSVFPGLGFLRSLLRVRGTSARRGQPGVSQSGGDAWTQTNILRSSAHLWRQRRKLLLISCDRRPGFFSNVQKSFHHLRVKLAAGKLADNLAPGFKRRGSTIRPV